MAVKTITNQIEQPIARIAANATVDTTTELAHTYITEYIASHHLPNVKQISIASLKEFSKNIFIEGTYTAICPLVHKLVNEHGQKIGIKEEHIEIFFPKDTRPKTVTHMLTALLCKYGTNLALSAVKQRMAPVITNNTEFSQRILSNIQILTSNTRQKSTQSYSRLFTVFVALNSLIGS